MNGVLLAGPLQNLGDTFIEMLKDWGSAALVAILIVIVALEAGRRMSIKAGIGALLLMIIALGLYAARNDLAGMFETEIKEAGTEGAPAVIAPPVAGTGTAPDSGGAL
ncbi:hypothetical protein [Streptomyces mesophilus]|uniref:hypothetical protein n=1 Tax=Streptomyces mesophilus TaxID=1775132 RepID=UPI002E2C39A3|nr:hypothetical protein [Streptomyces mesophilus]